MMVVTDDLLNVVNLKKQFGGILALAKVNFKVRKGQIKALIGPNGAGKTTIFNLISGLYLPTAGRMYFKGNRIDGLPPYTIAQRGISRSFQNVQIFANMSVWENVMVGCHCRTKAGILAAIFRSRRARNEEKMIRKRSMEMLEFTGLKDRAFEEAANLTFQEQRLVEFARALATQPDLLLLDEPASGLNAGEAKEMARFILRIRDRGITVFLVEHVMDLVMEISDEVAVLNSGEIIAEGTPQQVQNDERVISAYLGEETENAEDKES